MDTQGFNVLLNLELGKKKAIYNRDRKAAAPSAGPTCVRKASMPKPPAGPTAAPARSSAGGGAAVSSVAGNVRNPATLRVLQPHQPERGRDRFHPHLARCRLQRPVGRLSPGRPGRRLPDRCAAGLQPDPARRPRPSTSSAAPPSSSMRNTEALCRAEPVLERWPLADHAVGRAQLHRLSRRPGQQRRRGAGRRAPGQPLLRQRGTSALPRRRRRPAREQRRVATFTRLRGRREGHLERVGLRHRPVCSRRTRSPTSAPATCSATWPSPC